MIRLELSTNAYRAAEVFAHTLIESDFSDYDHGLVFDGDKEFKQILELYLYIILEKSPEAAPRKETSLKLFNEHDALNAEYREKYGLEATESTMTLIKKLNETILATTDKKFAEVEEMLVGLAAVYAGQLILKCGGEWKWDDEYNSCTITKINGIRFVNPLVRIIMCWEDKEEDLDFLLSHFKKLPSDIID